VALEPLALIPLAESIADGSPVDWDAAEARASDDERGLVRQLRVLANLAVLHRSLPADPHDLPSASVARLTNTAPAIGSWAHLALVERLGGGTFGEVYRAWDRHLEREVALKLLRTPRRRQDTASAPSRGDESIDDPQASRITREGRLLARVRHPNVITVHGVAVHDDRVGLWMELIRGATLEHLLLKRGPFGAREAALFGIDLCRALAAIHAAGLIHRDVKAQNVMREEGGRLVLMDLGTGREMDPRRRYALPDLAGTPLYLAPEIFDGAPASERSDLYSLGVLLYHLVTGSFPVRATTIEELQEGHAKGAGVRLRDARADLPTPFVRVVDRAIASDPDRRYASAGALEADLVQTLDDTAAPVAADTATAKTRALPSAWRRAGTLAASLVALLVLGSLGWQALRQRPAPVGVPGPIRSIAVLPLANVSGDPSQEYFADGMTDELIGTLGRLGGINVISRTSAMQFKGSSKPLPEIARALNVDAVLEGSVLVMPGDRPQEPRGAQRVRINARLIYAGTDTQLWDRTFERVVADVLALQGEVAKSVADGIDVRLTSQEASDRSASRQNFQAALSNRRPVNPEAYETYLRARYLWNKRTPEDLRRALVEFKRSIDFDPTSALAWSGLADGYFLLADQGEMPPSEAMPLAEAAARKALELDESLAEAHASLAVIQWTYRWDRAAAEKEFARALVLNPSYATARQWYGLYQASTGRSNLAVDEMRRAQALDPLSLAIRVNVGRCYYFARQYDKAYELLQQVEQQEPGFWMVHTILGQTDLANGRFDAAIRQLDRARTLSPSSLWTLAVLGDAYGRAGRRADALKTAAELDRRSRTQYVSPVHSALVYMGLRDRTRALTFLEKSYAERSEWMTALIDVEPEFDPLRADPRFQELLRRVMRPDTGVQK